MLLQHNKIHAELEMSVVLHRRAYRESSLLLELLTESYGRVALIAKGARRAKGRAGLLQPFQLLLCSWKSKSELGVLTHCELASLATSESLECLNWQVKLHGSLLYCGLYLNELIMRTVQRGQAISGLLKLYRETIEKLQAHSSEAAVLREFEWKLVSLLGYAVSLSEDVNAQLIDKKGYYFYQVDGGLVKTVKASPEAISGECLLELAGGNWHNEATSQAARTLTRQALAPLVGNKPFASRSLYLGLKKNLKKIHNPKL